MRTIDDTIDNFAYLFQADDDTMVLATNESFRGLKCDDLERAISFLENEIEYWEGCISDWIRDEDFPLYNDAFDHLAECRYDLRHLKNWRDNILAMAAV